MLPRSGDIPRRRHHLGFFSAESNRADPTGNIERTSNHGAVPRIAGRTPDTSTRPACGTFIAPNYSLATVSRSPENRVTDEAAPASITTVIVFHVETVCQSSIANT